MRSRPNHWAHPRFKKRCRRPHLERLFLICLSVPVRIEVKSEEFGVVLRTRFPPAKLLLAQSTRFPHPATHALAAFAKRATTRHCGAAWIHCARGTERQGVWTYLNGVPRGCRKLRRDETDAKRKFCVTNGLPFSSVFYGKSAEACAAWSERWTPDGVTWWHACRPWEMHQKKFNLSTINSFGLGHDEAYVS